MANAGTTSTLKNTVSVNGGSLTVEYCSTNFKEGGIECDSGADFSITDGAVVTAQHNGYNSFGDFYMAGIGQSDKIQTESLMF